MAYIQDKTTKLYWKSYGYGTTAELDKAHVFSAGQAQALLRIFWDQVVVIDQEKDSTGRESWVEYSHSPDPKASPVLTKDMKDRKLVWVRYDDVWLATDIQHLVMGTLLAIKGEPAHEGLVA